MTLGRRGNFGDTDLQKTNGLSGYKVSPDNFGAKIRSPLLFIYKLLKFFSGFFYSPGFLQYNHFLLAFIVTSFKLESIFEKTPFIPPRRRRPFEAQRTI